MREIQTSMITSAVKKLCIAACCDLPPTLISALKRAREEEESPVGKNVLAQLIDNAEKAKCMGCPSCQDTGMAVVFMDIGQDVHIMGGNLVEAVNEGVRQGYGEGYMRKSVLHPLTRQNTGDNTPAILHTRIVDGDKIRITVAPKGFGSENMSRIKMLTPSAGMEGIYEFVVDTVKRAAANPCPPVVVGVGIGGTFEACALIAKRALLRDIGTPNPEPELAKMEEELLKRINALGIGPMGLGGSITALAVHIGLMHTHLAGLPVAVNMQCNAARHTEIVL